MYSPTGADDMLLMSFSKAGMDGLLDICWKYSITWRFFYNPEKCKIVVFNERTSPLQNRIFTIGPNVISETDNYSHLGVMCNQHLSSKDSIHKASNKLRGTYLNICNYGIHPSAMSHETLKTIYTSVVIPKALFGCELWNPYSQEDITKLERAH